jgi:hypothetical protein
MNELAMAIIGGRPAFVIQRIGEQLRRLLQLPPRKAWNESKRNEPGTTVCVTHKSDGDSEEEEEDQETSARTIRSLLAIVRMLTESGKIKRVVTGVDIQNAAFGGLILTEKEKEVAAKIVNFLRPFACQRTDENQPRIPYILARAPLAALANTIAKITGFHSLVQKVSVTPQEGLRALHLTASGLYDALHEQWDIPTNDGRWITNCYLAGKSKPTVFGAFFNTSRLESLMKSYGLQFRWRISFINKQTVRLLGVAKPGKTFKSNDEKRKKQEKYTVCTPAMDVTHQGRIEMETTADELVEQVKNLTNILRSSRKELSPLVLARMDPGSAGYRKLKELKKKILAKQFEITKLERELAKARSSLYAVNKALRTRPTSIAAADTTIDAPNAKIKEDKIELVGPL